MKNKNYIIYKITNNKTGKIYIGQTTRSIKERWIEHCKPSSSACPLLKKAIEKHGKENFTLEKIEECKSTKELNKREIYWINHYSATKKIGYNLSKGGIGNRTPLNEEQRKNISKKIKEKWTESNYRQAMKSTWTKERKKSFSEKMKNKPMSKETKEKLKQYKGSKSSRYGVKLSEETKKKISLAQKGKKRNQKYSTKPIICIETNKTYDSITECANDMTLNIKGISKVLRKTRKSYKGYTFKYLP